MITYMDSIVGKFVNKLEELDLASNTLLVFTGDNGSAVNLVSRLAGHEVRGGKRTMNEAGTRVPLIAYWPGTIPSGVRHSFFSLLDMLPTLASIAQTGTALSVDGMDLSHTFLGKSGIDRHYFSMAFEGDVFFVRDSRFRLHEDGRMYHVPVNSTKGRYSMDSLVPRGEHIQHRERLQAQLDVYMKIRENDNTYEIIPFGTDGDRFKNANRDEE